MQYTRPIASPGIDTLEVRSRAGWIRSAMAHPKPSAMLASAAAAGADDACEIVAASEACQGG